MSENRNLREINPFLLNRSEAAKFLGIGINTLSLLDIPKTQIRRRILYRRDILEEWVKEKTEVKINDYVGTGVENKAVGIAPV
jgi:serine protease inhibitor